MNVGCMLKHRGLSMPRQRFQRPEVRRMGTGKKQRWGCDYFIYVKDGEIERRIHKVGYFGFCSRSTKGKAQEACDRFMVTVNSGVAFADAAEAIDGGVPASVGAERTGTAAGDQALAGAIDAPVRFLEGLAGE